LGNVFNRQYEAVMTAAADALARTGIRPNTITALSLLPCLLAGICAALGWFIAAALLLLFGGAFDLLDGALARRTGQTSTFGALLDSTIDRLSDAAVPSGLALFYAPFGLPALAPILLISAGFTVSYVRARAEGLSLELPRLWMRREDRLIAMVVALLLEALPIAGIGAPHPVTLLIVAVLMVLSFAAALAALAAAARLTRG
jgi:CDP-diacylglycerol--glycerol-3-phosphate 3-phosphatidyltransferase